MHFWVLLGASFGASATARGFHDLDKELTERDTLTFPSIASAETSSARVSRAAPTCKTFPGDANWPSNTEWSRFNSSVAGALLQPLPPAAVCYLNSPAFNSERCSFLLQNASRTTFYLDDPVTILTQWPQGNTCLAVRNSTGTCTQGGFPSYVVNVTSVKQVQAAVNFARNKNIRLVIKNTGHDFVGRNTGAGALSIWTHYLKGFEFLPSYKQPGGTYNGPAARVGAGLQVYEAFTYAARHNVTLPAASCLTVGSYGGWITGGGHSPLSSKFGLGVDQVLSLQVVTADGRSVTADPVTNSDLFFAIRGGGGSTYGVITSAIVKAHPQINLTIASFTFTLGATASQPGPDPTITNSTAFWAGFNQVFAFGVPTVDAGGYLWTNGIRQSNTSFVMQVRVQMPGLTLSETNAFIQPLLVTLNSLGIPVANITPTTQIYSLQTGAIGGAPGNSRFASRIFPRKAYTDPTLFAAAMAAARATVEDGYVFHGLNMAPTLKVAGFPAPAGVNPVWRDSVMHADVFDSTNMAGISEEAFKAAKRRLDGHMDALRKATPGGGAYFNEADVQEPDWQNAFFGTNYDKLLTIKKSRDPTGVFWAPTTPGSDAWRIEGVDAVEGIPTQNGRLCRA